MFRFQVRTAQENRPQDPGSRRLHKKSRSLRWHPHEHLTRLASNLVQELKACGNLSLFTTEDGSITPTSSTWRVSAVGCTVSTVGTRLRRIQLILQLSSSRGFRLRKGDVKTAFLTGDREHAEPPLEMRDRLQITREQVLTLETAVYGLRNAPRA